MGEKAYAGAFQLRKETESYGYDTEGRPETVTTGTRQSVFAYDTQGNLASVTDPEENVFTYDYDDIGRVTAVHRPDITDTGNETVIAFDYDENGSMTVLTNPSAVDHGFGFNNVNLNSSYTTPLSGDYSYMYDKARRLTRKDFPSGAWIRYDYDPAKLGSIETSEGDAVSFAYSSCGAKVESVSRDGEQIGYEYDGSLVTSGTLTGTLAQTLSYTYNSDFAVQNFTYAGETRTYGYDNDGLLTGAGDLTVTRNAGNGLPESVTGGSLSLTRGFSGYGETENENFSAGGTELFSWSLVRDDNGRITEKTENLSDGTTANYEYDYDALGRLLAVTKDGAVVESYQYDIRPYGIRTYEERYGAGRSLRYNDEDNLLEAGDTAYQHDEDGFLISKTQGAEVTTYDYSLRGELLRVDLPDGRVIEYVHDPLGRRIAKKVDGVITEKYLWQGLTRLLAVYNADDTLKMRFEYADARMPVAMTKGDVTYYLGYDQVGTLKAVADASGTVVRSIEYDAFGNIFDETNPDFAVPFGFAGGLHDRDTDLVRFGYRDYDPETGRWTAKDPIGFAGGDTDLYGYCLNDPVNFIDPNGLEFWSAFGEGLVDGVIGAAVVAGIAAAAITVAPAAAATVTGGLFIAGAVGGASLLHSMAINHCPDNIGYNLGSLTGGAIVGGLTGTFLNSKLSPPGQASPGLKGWGLKREATLVWKYNRSETLRQNWNKAMGTGPTKLSAAGSVAGAGSGLATDGPCNSCF